MWVLGLNDYDLTEANKATAFHNKENFNTSIESRRYFFLLIKKQVQKVLNKLL